MLLNLHSHLEGCVRPETAVELAAQQGVPDPPGGWEHAMVMSQPADLTTFLQHVSSVYPLLGTREALARVAFEAVEDACADGQDYLELRFGPSTHTRHGLHLKGVVAAVLDGVKQGAAANGMPVGVIVCLLRHETDQVNHDVATVACNNAGSGVVGLDLAGDELRFPELHRYVPMFDRARRAGLGITVHAGEAAPGQAVVEATRVLGARRIGHGSRIADDPELLAWAAREQLCFEVCPSSNVLTGAAASLDEHPIQRFLDAGCHVALGDDDPITTGVRLSQEQSILRRQLPLTGHQLDHINQCTLEAAFCDTQTRTRLAL